MPGCLSESGCSRDVPVIHCYGRDRLSDEVKAQFELLGSAYIKRLAMRDAWAFVGQRGLQDKSTIEEVILCPCPHKSISYSVPVI